MSMSPGMHLGLFLCITITTVVVVRGQSAGPNAIALINGQTMLDCNTFDLSSSNWRHSPDGINDFITIAFGCIVTGNNAAYYRTEVIGDNICRLIIANATMQQGGVYNCYDGGSSVYRSLVTVIDQVASVVVYNRSEVVEGDKLNISCSINYNGPTSPAPSLRPSTYWTTSPLEIFTSAIQHPSPNVVTLIATVTVQKYTVPIFQCNTVFEITGNTSGYNSTAPADNLTVGSTKEIIVQYPVETINISSTVPADHNCVSKLENLTCTANANPPAQYMWLDLKNNTNTTGAAISISSGGDYQCIAFNSIRNQIHSEKKNVTEASCSVSSPLLMAVGSSSFIWPGSSSLIWLGWILGVLFAIYYGLSGKKSPYNRHFPFLEKMLPCMNTNVNAKFFERCSWIILYILMVTFAGILIIPFMVIKVQFFSSANAAVDFNNVELSGTSHPENNAPPPKETTVDETTNEETVTKKAKKRKKKKKKEATF